MQFDLEQNVNNTHLHKYNVNKGDNDRSTNCSFFRISYGLIFVDF